MWPTIVVGGVVAALLIWVIAVQIRNRKNGKSSCSCGGNCGACGMNCHGQAASTETTEN